MIERLELTHFKSFRHAEIGFGDLTLIAGTNASGKSNLRDALRFLHGVGLGFSLAEIIGGKCGPGGIHRWRGIRGGPRAITYHSERTFGVRAVVRAPRSRAPWIYDIVVEIHEHLGPRVMAEALRAGDAHVFEADSRSSQPRGEQELTVRQYDPPGYNMTRPSAFASHTPVLSQVPGRRLRAAAACEAVLEVLRSMRFLDLDPDAMRESSPPGPTVLGDRGENLSSVLQGLCRDEARKAQLLAWVRSVTPMGAEDFRFLDDLQGRVLAYLVESKGRWTSAVSASDGTLRFLALVAALLSPSSGRIYSLEELDHGLHPTRLHLLLDLIRQACDYQGVQVIGMTHNPALLALLEPEAREHVVLAYRPEGAPDTRLKRILDLPDEARVLETQDLGRLHTSGWLEDTAELSEPEEGGAPRPARLGDAH